MTNEQPHLDDVLERLLAFRNRLPNSAMIDALSELTTADLDIAIRVMRDRQSDRRQVARAGDD